MLTAAVGSDGFQGAPKCAAMLFQDRDQRIIVRPVIAHITVDDEIVLYCDLDIIGRLELAVLHMVLFHPHERCFQVSLGIAVPVFSHDLKVGRRIEGDANCRLFFQTSEKRLRSPRAGCAIKPIIRHFSASYRKIMGLSISCYAPFNRRMVGYYGKNLIGNRIFVTFSTVIYQKLGI